MRLLWIALSLQLSGLAVCFADGPTATGGRVETSEELDGYQGYHEIERLGLFLAEPGEIELPDLKKANILTIDSDEVTAISLPSLESVKQLTIRGRNITKIELPNLKHVSGFFRVQGTSVSELDLPSFRYAGALLVAANPNLEEVNTPFTYELERVSFANNPLLDEGVQEQLKSLVVPSGAKQKPTFMSYSIRLRSPSIGPTGRKAARFDTRSPPRVAPRHDYPRYRPFFPIYRPFLGGYWGFGGGFF